MSKRIERVELSVPDPFKDVRDSERLTRIETELLLKELRAVADAIGAIKVVASGIKGSLLSTDTGSLAGIEKKVKLNREANGLLADEQRLQKEKIRLENDLKKVTNDSLKQENDRIRLLQQRATLEERAEKRRQKEIADQEKLNSVYSRVQAKLTKLTQEYRNLAIRKELGNSLTDKEAKRYEFLQTRITKYDGALKAVDASMGRHQRNVGNYSSAFNGLGNSVQQLTREFPAFAVNMQTGFLAISNNLPIFFDEVAKLKIANQQLAASGQPVTSVFKQISGSILSVTGILGLAVTAITVLGPKLVDWFKSLDSGNKALEVQQARQKAANEQSKKAVDFIGEESSGYVGLILQLKKTNQGSTERTRLIKQINDQYHVTLRNLQDEAKFQEMLNNEVLDYIEYTRLRLKAESNDELLKKRIKMREEDVRALRSTEKAERDLRKAVADTEKEFRFDPEEANRRNAARIAALNANIEKQNQLNGAISEHDRRLFELGGTALDVDMKIRGSKYFFEDIDKSTKDVKELTTALKEFDDELARRIELGNQERALRQAILEMRQDAQISDVSRLINQELENQKTFAKESGEIYVDTLEKLIQEEAKLRREAAQQRADFQLDELQKSIDQEHALRFEELDKELEELLKQENLTNEAKLKLAESYSERQQQLAEQFLEQEAVNALKREKIELELKQSLEALDREEVNRLNEVNDELIELQQGYADKTAEVRKKDLEAEKKQQKEITELRKKTINQILDEELKASKKREELADKDIAANQKLADQIRASSDAGNADAKKSIAAAEQEINRANARKAQEQAKQQRIEREKLFYQAIENFMQKGDDLPAATAKSITGIAVVDSVLNNILSKIPKFRSGTPDTGRGGSLDQHGGFLSMLHPRERVVESEENARLIAAGSPSNRDVVDGYLRAQRMDMTGAARSVAGAGSPVRNSSETYIRPLLKGIEQLNETLSNVEFNNIDATVREGVIKSILHTQKKGSLEIFNKHVK